ncbi:MAG TPA: hypothetical protein DCQ83_08785 [Fibrobacteres bacterium]|jgi:hypothetical protein|nr:hypothetical protein [Fibrobacterota bacterium]
MEREMKRSVLIFLTTLGIMTALACSQLPTGVTLKAFYDTNAVNLKASLAKITSIAEVPGLPKHLFALDLKGKLWGIFPNATGYSGLSWVNYTGTAYTKTLLADFSSDTHYSAEGEAGAYSVVFSPLYATNRKFYIWYYKNNAAWAASLPKYYTGTQGGITTPFNGEDPFGNPAGDFVLDEYQTNDSATAVTRLRQVFYVHQQPAVGSGTAKFGPDGYLYLTTGSYDGEARNLHNNLNKVLRIDVTTPPPSGASYVIPSDNPYVGAISAIDSVLSLGTKPPNYPPFVNSAGVDTAIKKEIWARGFRNPWTLAFDPDSGFLWMGEILQDRNEEINLIVKGGNYGWNRGGDLNNLGDGNYGGSSYGWGFSGPCASAASPEHKPGGDSCKYYTNPAYSAPRSGSHALQCVIAGTVFHGSKTSPFYGYLLGTDNTLDTLWAFKKGDAAPQSIGHPNNFGNNVSHRGMSAMVSGIDGTVYVAAMDWYDPANRTYKGTSAYFELYQLSSPALTTKTYAELTTDIKIQNKRMTDKFTNQPRLMVDLGLIPSAGSAGNVYDLSGKLKAGHRSAGVYYLKPSPAH